MGIRLINDHCSIPEPQNNQNRQVKRLSVLSLYNISGSLKYWFSSFSSHLAVRWWVRNPPYGGSHSVRLLWQGSQ
ncbi:MAG: hypothetical protein IJ187_05080 [Neisseriaceae bacterium]|nr:hypothetical protein [Neisseriaceae bacterium]